MGEEGQHSCREKKKYGVLKEGGAVPVVKPLIVGEGEKAQVGEEGGEVFIPSVFAMKEEGPTSVGKNYT